jgi:hypothetical protein
MTKNPIIGIFLLYCSQKKITIPLKLSSEKFPDSIKVLEFLIPKFNSFN